MGSTTVHIPDDILERVDRLAARRGVSRNKIVIKALSEELSRDQGEWPENFFEPPKDPEARALLEEATQEMEAAVARSRQNRGAPGL